MKNWTGLVSFVLTVTIMACSGCQRPPWPSKSTNSYAPTYSPQTYKAASGSAIGSGYSAGSGNRDAGMQGSGSR